MSFFRQFNKTVCASRFTKPNNILLAQSPQVYLCTSNEPCIDHLNTLKSLVRTINKLQANTAHGTYQNFVKSELQILNNSLAFYSESSRRFVEVGGRLTAQGLANLYACADTLNINDQWLKVYAESEVPHLIRYMSIENLKDLKEGLSKYNGSKDFISLVEKELKTRNDEPVVYVERAVNEISVFEEVDNKGSNNLLVNAIESNTPLWQYYLRKFAKLPSSYLNSTGYALD